MSKTKPLVPEHCTRGSDLTETLECICCSERQLPGPPGSFFGMLPPPRKAMQPESATVLSETLGPGLHSDPE